MSAAELRIKLFSFVPCNGLGSWDLYLHGVCPGLLASSSKFSLPYISPTSSHRRTTATVLVRVNRKHRAASKEGAGLQKAQDLPGTGSHLGLLVFRYQRRYARQQFLRWPKRADFIPFYEAQLSQKLVQLHVWGILRQVAGIQPTMASASLAREPRLNDIFLAVLGGVAAVSGDLFNALNTVEHNTLISMTSVHKGELH